MMYFNGITSTIRTQVTDNDIGRLTIVPVFCDNSISE